MQFRRVIVDMFTFCISVPRMIKIFRLYVTRLRIDSETFSNKKIALRKFAVAVLFSVWRDEVATRGHRLLLNNDPFRGWGISEMHT